MIRKKFFVLAILIILYSGCGEEQFTDEEFYSININLAPRTQEDVSPKISKIRITVSADDIKTIVKDYTIETGKSEFSGTVDIPVGTNRKISVEAYDEEDNLIYSGNKTITGQEMLDISADENPPVVIMLDPVKEKIVKLFPSLIEVNSGDSFTVDIIVKNFPVLFGVTFRLKFNENYVKPVEVDAIGADKLLGNSVIYIDDINQSSREPGSLNIGITRISGSTEDEEGVIAEVKFEAVSATDETVVSIDYDSIVWTEDSEFPPPKEPQEEKLKPLKKYSDRGETTVIIR